MKNRRETIEVEVEEDDDGSGVGSHGSRGEKLLEADWWGIWERYRWMVVFILGVLTLGTLALVSFWPSEPAIEILPAVEEKTLTTLFVDLEGAVEKPGIYELPADSRVNDLLVRAGGLSGKADRAWVAKNLNLAQSLADGGKIYIPAEGEFEKLAQSGGDVAGAAISGREININTADVSELDALWGIGEARAKSIIAGRPYQKIEELLEKKIVPSNVFERIKTEITVY